MISAKILADSRHPSNGSRLTTFELTYPRFIHSELMTHRKFSRNSASSRAIPTSVLLEQVKTNPVIPIHWGRLQSGMQATQELGLASQQQAEYLWLKLRDDAVKNVELLYDLKLHKQIVNRLLEPWMWITVVATSDNYGLQNFFKLRCHEAAEPHIRLLANRMRNEYETNMPLTLQVGEWHSPYSDDIIVSVARCARLSYLNQLGKLVDGKRVAWSKADDYALHDRLASMGHWSPFEHQAECCDPIIGGSNFGDGWFQYRKTFKGEDGCS